MEMQFRDDKEKKQHTRDNDEVEIHGEEWTIRNGHRARRKDRLFKRRINVCIDEVIVG